jgi:ribosomal protein S18 acetylase RimI-like enzyme
MYRRAAIREYRSSDEPILFGLARSTFGEAPGWADRRTLETLEHDLVFVAEVEGRPAGYEALATGRTVVRIDQLLVSPDHDDEGIEGQLVEYAEGYAISVGARALEAVVEQDNAQAIAFYRGRGFARAGESLVRLVLPHRP